MKDAHLLAPRACHSCTAKASHLVFLASIFNEDRVSPISEKNYISRRDAGTRSSKWVFILPLSAPPRLCASRFWLRPKAALGRQESRQAATFLDPCPLGFTPGGLCAGMTERGPRHTRSVGGCSRCESRARAGRFSTFDLLRKDNMLLRTNRQERGLPRGRRWAMLAVDC